METVHGGEPSLTHAGVKGMRWGVRKKRQVSPDRVNELTTAELQTRLNRLRLERDYKALVAELTAQPPTRARKFIDKVLVPGATKGGQKVISELVSTSGKSAVSFLLGQGGALQNKATTKRETSPQVSKEAPPAPKHNIRQSREPLSPKPNSSTHPR